MAALGEWVKHLIFLVLFAAFLELLLPSHAMQRFLRVVIGMLVLLAVLKPAADLAAEGYDWQTLPVFQAARTTVKHSSASDGRQEDLTRVLYQKELERQMRASVASMPEVASAAVTVRVDGVPSAKAQADLIGAVKVCVRPAAQAHRIEVSLQKKTADALTPQLQNKIMQRLHALYEIPVERIAVEAEKS